MQRHQLLFSPRDCLIVPGPLHGWVYNVKLIFTKSKHTSSNLLYSKKPKVYVDIPVPKPISKPITNIIRHARLKPLTRVDEVACASVDGEARGRSSAQLVLLSSAQGSGSWVAGEARVSSPRLMMLIAMITEPNNSSFLRPTRSSNSRPSIQASSCNSKAMVWLNFQQQAAERPQGYCKIHKQAVELYNK